MAFNQNSITSNLRYLLNKNMIHEFSTINEKRSRLLCSITRSSWMVIYRRLGTTYRSQHVGN